MLVVGSELFTLDLAVDEVRSLDLANMGPDRLGRVAIEVGLHIDRMKAAHALIVVEADRARSWYASGAAISLTGWRPRPGPRMVKPNRG
jgi:hypothetical protein